ncbi:MAG: hypothetical protein Q7U10_04810 [Thermodesulfovibrionia bacterium]|nr:hypothetical protein [Thermodesulfovibrionia bacterium]
MNEDIDKEISKKYCPRFGMIAVDMGYVTPNQLKEALAKQIEDDLSARPHRVIGRIFFEEGRMTHQQIETVLNKLFKEKRGGEEEVN